MNIVALIGRLTKDPALITIANDHSVCNFTVAVNNRNNEVSYISCTAWNRLAENLCRFCCKGTRISLQGELKTRTHENKNGQKVYSAEVRCRRIEFLESRKEKNGRMSTNSRDKRTNKPDRVYAHPITTLKELDKLDEYIAKNRNDSENSKF